MLTECKEKNIEYPIALVDNRFKIYFKHYASFDEGVTSWNKRSLRIIKEKLICIFIQRDGCTEDDLMNFDKIPFKNKYAFVYKKYPQLKCAQIILPNPDNKLEVEDLTAWTGLFKKGYDKINWIKIFDSIIEK